MRKNFWNSLKKPLICLAPMAGISDQPFRLMCKKFGAEVVYSEMVSSDAIYYQKIPNNKIQKTNKFQLSKSQISNVSDIGKFEFGAYLNFGACDLRFTLLKTLNLIRFSEAEMPFVVQIFGADPEKMAHSAEYISLGEWVRDYRKITNNKSQMTNKFQYQMIKNSNSLKIGKLEFDNYLEYGACDLEIASIPSGIDINMGCPARDVIKIGAGSALIKDPKRVSEIIKAIKKKTKLPVSIKTRLGWDDPKSILKFARILEYSGADALTIHARTYKQGFSGKPDWKVVYQVRRLVKIPVILNGGIETLEDFQKVDFDKVDGVMIGRGAWGRPWIFQELKNPNCQLSLPRRQAGIPNFQLMKDIILEHACLVDRLKGKQGIIEFRKHLAWYFKGIPNCKKLREKLVKVNNYQEIVRILNSY